jgi:hypothetical protein
VPLTCHAEPLQQSRTQDSLGGRGGAERKQHECFGEMAATAGSCVQPDPAVQPASLRGSSEFWKDTTGSRVFQLHSLSAEVSPFPWLLLGPWGADGSGSIVTTVEGE